MQNIILALVNRLYRLSSFLPYLIHIPETKVITLTINMNFLSTTSRRDRHEETFLLGSGPDDSYAVSESQQPPDLSSRSSSPTLSSRNEQEPFLPRTLNLEFGPSDSIQAQEQSSQPRADISREIHHASESLKGNKAVYRECKVIYNDAVRQIDDLARQYNEEREKAPIYPPKGTWFHQERKTFPQKQAQHEDKLRFILRLRQTVIDNDLAKAKEKLDEATSTLERAQTKLDDLRREKNMTGV